MCLPARWSVSAAQCWCGAFSRCAALVSGSRPTAQSINILGFRSGASKRLPASSWPHKTSRMNSIDPAVSIVVPVRNEADNIAPLVAEIAKAVDGQWRFEVVYVDDGSNDGTEAQLTGLMPQYPWLRRPRHKQSCGQSAAVRTGVAAARAPIVVTLDGDGQNDPAFIPALIRALEAGGPGIGLVAGQRVGRKASGFKKFQSRVANAVRGAVLRDVTRDTGCGLKAFRRDAFLRLPYFDGLHRFLPALVRREGYIVGYVDVVDRPRAHGVSNYGMWDRLWVGILDLAGVWWLIRRKKRIPEISEEEMLIDIPHPLGGYLHDVFFGNADWGALFGYFAQEVLPCRLLGQWI